MGGFPDTTQLRRNPGLWVYVPQSPFLKWCPANLGECQLDSGSRGEPWTNPVPVGPQRKEWMAAPPTSTHLKEEPARLEFPSSRVVVVVVWWQWWNIRLM